MYNMYFYKSSLAFSKKKPIAFIGKTPPVTKVHVILMDII